MRCLMIYKFELNKVLLLSDKSAQIRNVCLKLSDIY